ncbi:MAG TPA: hypothetical protein VFA26_07455, partial [Gemmataceae bacterium]|nr:hypothetical protein [Gemmataceae bacterium]
MPAAPLSCPYCNALVPLPAGARSGQRLPCPRCGEAFAYHGPDAEAVSPTPPALPPNRLDLSAGPALAAGRRRPNWLVAAGVLGVMAVMALAGLLYALNTEGVRREHDWRLPKDRSLPLYLTVFAGLWLAGLVGVALWELQSRCRRGPDGGPRRVPWGVALGVVTVVAAAGVGLAVLAVRINENRASRPALPDAP